MSGFLNAGTYCMLENSKKKLTWAKLSRKMGKMFLTNNKNVLLANFGEILHGFLKITVEKIANFLGNSQLNFLKIYVKTVFSNFRNILD